MFWQPTLDFAREKPLSISVEGMTMKKLILLIWLVKMLAISTGIHIVWNLVLVQKLHIEPLMPLDILLIVIAWLLITFKIEVKE